ncbi:MAG: LLM class flavin-dependent oxidoreductase [Halioglobus sp.]
MALRHPPPMLLGAMGPRALALAGRYYDGVLLHPFLTNEAVAKAAEIVRTAAHEAGRDRDACKVWSTLVVAAEQSADETLAIGPARLLTYVHMAGYGELVCAANGWDPAACPGRSRDYCRPIGKSVAWSTLRTRTRGLHRHRRERVCNMRMPA